MGESILEIMRKRAEAHQAETVEIGSWLDMVDYVIKVTISSGGKRIAHFGLPAEALRILEENTFEKGLDLLSPPMRRHVGRIDTALTFGGWGIAETGTLVLDSSPEDLRIITSLSTTHVAVLLKENIKGTAFELEAELDSIMSKPSAYIAFISGASRTADIERVLTIGVHGPKYLHLLFL